MSSSELNAIGFDDEAQILEIEFQDRSICQYIDVPFHHYRSLLNSYSKGQYFSAHIEGHFPCRRVR